MQRSIEKTKYQLGKLSNRRTGWPLATLACYGPNASTASKAVLSLMAGEGSEPESLKKWFRDTDVRSDVEVLSEVLELVQRAGVARIVMPDRVIGCPHEEGKDYEGEYCPAPACAFWFGRDRWTGKLRE